MPPAPDMAGGGAAAVTTADMWLIDSQQQGVIDRVRELWGYRRLLWYFASDALRRMYQRSALGWFWMVMRVSGPIGVSAMIFGGMLDVPSDGVPYFLFFLCGTTTWTLFDRGLIYVTRSLEQNRRLVLKVYFPRIILPIAFVAPALLYLAMVLAVLVIATVYFHHHDGIWYVTISPRLFASAGAVVLSLFFTVAVGLWTSVLQLRYRDVRYGLRYFMPFWQNLTPIIYPLSFIPHKYHWLIALNPMAPIVETFKWGTLGKGTFSATGLVTSSVLIALTLVSGVWFFNREEAASIDKI
jgi:lipopolysaccharide transport system permease protein